MMNRLFPQYNLPFLVVLMLSLLIFFLFFANTRRLREGGLRAAATLGGGWEDG